VKINIVNGFFLPIPPLAGGATEKTWFNLAREFARCGHDVCFFSRQWPGLPDEETVEGIQHIRIPGYDHSSRLPVNIWRDFNWSRRITRALPPADITVVNAVTLPVWLGRRRPDAGKVIIMTGRVPKGQYRFYQNIAGVIASSSPVLAQVNSENPSLGAVAQVMGYPIDAQLFNSTKKAPNSHSSDDLSTIGFISRLHREKGLSHFVSALQILSKKTGLPPWRVLICGPVDIAQGGSGRDFLDAELNRLKEFVPTDRITLLPPQFDPTSLAAIYRSVNIFCLPSLAEKGETFGVAIVEAMAASCAAIVSDLPCFRDFVEPEDNALTYDHQANDAPNRLADQIKRLLIDPDLRARISQSGQLTAQRYDFPNFAQSLLERFQSLLASEQHPSPPA